MYKLSAFIETPGAIDAFAYRACLFVLNAKGEILTFDVAQLMSGLREERPREGAIISYGLFSSRGIGALPEVKKTWRNFDHKSSYHLNISPSPAWRSAYAIEASAHLDMKIFYDQIFLATDNGTFRVPLTVNGSISEDRSDVECMLKEPTASLSTGMGAVAASLGDEGLAVFATISDKNDQVPIRVNNRSLRSSIGWGQAINHPANDSYEVLLCKTSDDKSGRRTLLDVSGSDADGSGVKELQAGAYAVWESGRLLVADSQGIDTLGRFHGRKRSLSTESQSHVISLNVTGNRCLVTESVSRLTATREDQSVVLHEGQAASVRTFGNSHRYQRLIASTVEGGVLLSAAVPSMEARD